MSGKDTAVVVRHSLIPRQVVDLVLIWAHQNPKEDLDKLNKSYVYNICRNLLEQHGKDILEKPIDEKVYLRRQEIVSALRGLVNLS